MKITNIKTKFKDTPIKLTMATLETQYENYMSENPNSTYSFEEWFDNVWRLKFVYWDDEDMSDWDNTLLDGLDDKD